MQKKNPCRVIAVWSRADATLTEALKEAAQLKKALAAAEKQEEKLGKHFTAEAAKAKKAAEVWHLLLAALCSILLCMT